MASWQNFYFLVGSSAAGLMGLMFIAVTFGAELVRKDNLEQVNTFLGSICFHFIQVLLFCCVASMPNASNSLIGTVVAIGAGWRLIQTPTIFRNVRESSLKREVEIEKSDWLMTLILPTLIYIFMLWVAVAFYSGEEYARTIFAYSLIAMIMLGIRGAWEMIIWMATQIEKKS